ncbi:hypothetical protein EA187_15960 [Lujinxingia sediminis]|uniref:Beta-lactamase n=1 Tax=Lujinxingia sediminis TaxID=2480984 RepID=A0ABY0CPH0_9DELT|nr:hypothetical protein [Lujinxingia sediminis]RVU42372.1 hypothetical protein EA187_15960 [Lujinxingia sediminis]
MLTRSTRSNASGVLLYLILTGVWLTLVGCASGGTAARSTAMNPAFERGWTADVDAVCAHESWDDDAEIPLERRGYAPYQVFERYASRDLRFDLYEKQCSEGRAEGCLLVGLMFNADADEPDADPRARSAAYDAFLQGCSLNFGPACTAAVNTLLHHPDVDPEAAASGKAMFGLVGAACYRGDADGCRILARDVEFPESASPDLIQDLVVQGNSLGCIYGDPQACTALSLLRIQNNDQACAAAALRRGCALNDKEACQQVETIARTQCASGSDLCNDMSSLLERPRQKRPPTWRDGMREACANDDPFSCHLLAHMTLVDGGSPDEMLHAIDMLQTSCQANIPGDCTTAYNVARYFFDNAGSEIPLDPAILAARVIAAATVGCDAGNRDICFEGAFFALPTNLAITEHLEIDIATSVELSLAGCHLGHGQACAIPHLIRPLLQGETLANLNRAVEELHDEHAPLCEQLPGDTSCLLTGAALYAMADIEHQEQGFKLIEKNCDANHQESCSYLDLVAGRPQRTAVSMPHSHLQCLSPGEEIPPITCSSGPFQSLSPRQYAARHGCGVSDITALTSSHQRPVETCEIQGQQAFLMNLQCADGSTPVTSRQAAASMRQGSRKGGGRCNNPVDLYVIPCPEGDYEVYIDLYMCPAP